MCTDCWLYTCNELSIAKIQANTLVSLLTASMPIIQVNPSTGSRITMALAKSLQYTHQATLYIIV